SRRDGHDRAFDGVGVQAKAVVLMATTSPDPPNLVVAIMAGGAGTRFWPASTRARPKQFLRLVGDRTMLQQSFDRARALTSVDRVYVVTNAAFVGLVREQLPDLAAANVVGEPERKDTAAAAVLATLLAERCVKDGVV